MLIRRLITEEDGQSITEYILVFSFIVIALTGVMALWKTPIAIYLNKIAQTIAKTR